MFVISILMALLQGAPIPAAQTGTVTGVLRNSAGAPAPGIRVAAIARDSAAANVVSEAAMVSLTETDIQGSYRLESIPPGRYTIAAGRLDVPTYYPGVLEAGGGKEIVVAAGVTVSGIDFALRDNSFGRANENLFAASLPTTFILPVTVAVEGGSKLPVFVAGKFPMLRLTRTLDGNRQEIPVNGSGFVIPISPSLLEYRLTMEGLPDGYAVTSMKDGTTDLQTETLRITPGNASASALRTLSAISLQPGGAVTRVFSASVPIPVSPASIAVVLGAVPPPPVAGVRVTGMVKGPANRSIYLSGNAGTLFADGTFEFRGVAPGRHTIVTLDNPGSVRPLGNVLIVGDRDVTGIELQEILIVPANPSTPAAPRAAGAYAPGATVPFSVIRGRVLESSSQMPLDAGRITINGNSAMTYSLGTEGQFEIPNLLPGTYTVSVWAYGLGSTEKTVTMEDEPIEMELTIRPPE